MRARGGLVLHSPCEVFCGDDDSRAGIHARWRSRRREVRFEGAAGQSAWGPDAARRRDLSAAKIRFREALPRSLCDRGLHGHGQVPPERGPARRGPEGEARPAHPHGEDGADDRPHGRLLHARRREPVHQQHRHRPVRRLPPPGDRPVRGVEIPGVPPRDLGKVLRRLRRDRAGDAPPRRVERARGPLRRLVLRAVLHPGLPEGVGGLPRARRSEEMACVVLAPAEPPEVRVLPGPQHARDGGALLPEPP